MISNQKGKHRRKKKSISGVHLRAPKGFFFEISGNPDYEVQVNLIKKWAKRNVRVGYVRLENAYYNSGTLETHSWLMSSYRRKGLGALMYARAIQYGLDSGYKVQSSGVSSDMAVRVWEGKYIRRFFHIETDGGTYGYSPTWYAYPKKNHKRITK